MARVKTPRTGPEPAARMPTILTAVPEALPGYCQDDGGGGGGGLAWDHEGHKDWLR